MVDPGIGYHLGAVGQWLLHRGDDWLLDGLQLLGMEAAKLMHVLRVHPN